MAEARSGAEAAPDAPDAVRNTTTLLRFIGGIAAWGFLSLGGAMALWSFDDHTAHVVVFIPLGLAGAGVMVFARRLARRIHRGG